MKREQGGHGIPEPRPTALLLDRDGVINRELGRAVLTWSEFEFLPGVLEALRELRSFPGPIIVATNQSAIGRGWTTPSAVDDIHERMLVAVAAAGGRIDDVLICPHAPESDCACRKPRPGLFRQAAERHRFDLRGAWAVGDSQRDAEAALSVGAQPILLRTGKPLPPDVVILESRGVLLLDSLQDVAKAVGRFQ